MTPSIGTKVALAPAAIDALIGLLRAEGYRVIGPTIGEGAVVYDEISSTADLPAGWQDSAEPGQYRLESDASGRWFAYSLGAQGWKRYLFPPRHRLFRAERAGHGFHLVTDNGDEPPLAFLGVRACELAAMGVQQKVFGQPDFAEPGYLRRREQAFIVAVECARSVSTCFCVSAGTGPAVEGGVDLLLNEIADKEGHRFIAEAGSEKGLAVLKRLPAATPSEADVAAAAEQPAVAASQQTRQLPDDVAGILARSLESPHWETVAARCLTCANCTMVCPTCFCTTVEDVTDLTGAYAERWRNWDSCFSIEYSYIHGGSVRQKPSARYRQWITHKLSTWHQQFGTSGCIGCGRCIAWCPVGIDITAEARVLAEADAAADKGRQA